MIPITKLTSEATPLEVPKKRWLNLGGYFQFGPIIKKKFEMRLSLEVGKLIPHICLKIGLN